MRVRIDVEDRSANKVVVQANKEEKESECVRACRRNEIKSKIYWTNPGVRRRLPLHSIYRVICTKGNKTSERAIKL